MSETLVQHLEKHLGRIAQGWADTGDIQVVQFPNQPHRDVVTYSTLGLSSTPLLTPGGRTMRQELLISVGCTFEPKEIASFLLTFAEHVRGQHGALLRGDVVGPSEPLIPGARSRAVYASIPVFFEDDFATYPGSSPPTVLVWLIPLPLEDAILAKAHGWEAFEEMLETADVDFWDLNRLPI
ncbi:MAG: suppressor of fused domain protein, partial [Polyangiaceae bacterium]